MREAQHVGSSAACPAKQNPPPTHSAVADSPASIKICRYPSNSAQKYHASIPVPRGPRDILPSTHQTPVPVSHSSLLPLSCVSRVHPTEFSRSAKFQPVNPHSRPNQPRPAHPFNKLRPQYQANLHSLAPSRKQRRVSPRDSAGIP